MTLPLTGSCQCGTLDDTRNVEPKLHIWTRNRQAWFALPARARTFDTEPTTSAKWLRDAAGFRAAHNPNG